MTSEPGDSKLKVIMCADSASRLATKHNSNWISCTVIQFRQPERLSCQYDIRVKAMPCLGASNAGTCVRSMRRPDLWTPTDFHGSLLAATLPMNILPSKAGSMPRAIPLPTSRLTFESRRSYLCFSSVADWLPVPNLWDRFLGGSMLAMLKKKVEDRTHSAVWKNDPVLLISESVIHKKMFVCRDKALIATRRSEESLPTGSNSKIALSHGPGWASREKRR